VESQEIIESLCQKHPWRRQRTEAVRHFLENLFRWIEYHDRIRKNPNKFEQWSKSYRFYAENRDENTYPLPVAVLKQWNVRFYEIFSWLRELKVLEPDAHPYWPNWRQSENPSQIGNLRPVGKCRYYSLNKKPALEKVRNSLDVLLELQAAGVSQAEIAKHLKLNLSTINQWQRGKRRPDQSLTPSLDMLLKHRKKVDGKKAT